MTTIEGEKRDVATAGRPTPGWEAWTEWQPEDLPDPYWPPRQGPRVEGKHRMADRDADGPALVAAVS